MKAIMFSINVAIAALGSILWAALCISVVSTAGTSFANPTAVRLAIGAIPFLALLWCNAVALFKE